MEILLNALEQGIAPAIIIAAYLIIIRYIDVKKENKQAKLNSDLIKSISAISNYIVSITKNIVEKDKDKCKHAVENAMYSSGMRLINFVSTTLVNNHIDTNKINIIENIHNIINAEYYTVYSVLNMYIIDEKHVSDYLDKQWQKDIEEDMLDIIYNNCMNKEDKIVAFTNKLNIKFQSYITFIINHIV